MMGEGNGHYGKLKTTASSKSVASAHFHAQLCMHINSVHKDKHTQSAHAHTRRDLKPLVCPTFMKWKVTQTFIYYYYYYYFFMNKITQTYFFMNNILNVTDLSQIVNFATKSAPPHTNSNQI